ncbi:MAG: ComEC/Rec2 family competence protein [Clostridia bacterium]
MNRPFAFLGFSFLLGLMVAFFISQGFAILISLLLLCVFIVLLILKKRIAEFNIVLIGFSLSSFVLFGYNYLFVDFYESYEYQTVTLKAILGDVISESDFSITYSAEVFEINGEEVSAFKIKLNSAFQFVYDVGDSFEGTVSFSESDDSTMFSLKKSMISDGYFLYGKVDLTDNYSLTTNNYTDIIYSFRRCIINKANEIFSDDIADLMIAMLVGDNSKISDDGYKDFLYAGVSHIIVVSGMHLSVVFLFLSVFLRKMRLPFLVVYFLLIPTIIFYMLVCGLGKSVLRSGIMFIGVLIGKSLGERCDSLNFLGLSVLLICLFSPYSAVDLGFLMSVSATGGIIFLSPKISQKILKNMSKTFYKAKKFVVDILAVSVSAYLFVFPILLLFNSYINPVSIVSACVLTVPTSIFLVLGILCCSLAFVPFLGNLCVMLAVFVKIIGKFIIDFCSVMAIFGRNSISLYEENAEILCIVFLCTVAVLSFYKISKKVKIMSIILAFLVTISLYVNLFFQSEKLRIVTADAGYGLFVMMMKEGKTWILSSDGYSSYAISSLFAEYAVQEIEYMDMDSESPSSVARYILDNYQVAEISSDSECELCENLTIYPIIENEIIKICYEDTVIVLDKIASGQLDFCCDFLIDCTHNSEILADLTLSCTDTLGEYEYEHTYIVQEENPITFTIEENEIQVRGSY